MWRIWRRRSPRVAPGAWCRPRAASPTPIATAGGEPAAAARAEAERLRESAWELLRVSASLCVVHAGASSAVRAHRKAGRARMIITVTLNAAIDKSLAVPNFRLRPASPHGGSAHDGGRQGREHRAHAEGARPAGDRDRLRGRRDRHAHRRAAHRGVDPQRLRAHPRGVAHEHLGARPDDRRADRDQRTRALGVDARGRAVPRQARCISRAARRSSCSPARCRAASSRTSTRR